jgi:cobalt/nickel transport protein
MKKLVILGLLVTVLLASVVSFYASGSPDGLERVAEDRGFLHTAKDSPVAGSPLADYGTKGVDDERLSVGLAGVAGVAIVLGLGTGLAYVVRRRTTDR